MVFRTWPAILSVADDSFAGFGTTVSRLLLANDAVVSGGSEGVGVRKFTEGAERACCAEVPHWLDRVMVLPGSSYSNAKKYNRNTSEMRERFRDCGDRQRGARADVFCTIHMVKKQVAANIRSQSTGEWVPR